MGKNFLIILLGLFLLSSCGNKDEIQVYIDSQTSKISKLDTQISATEAKKAEIMQAFSDIKTSEKISSTECEKGKNLAIFSKQNYFVEIGYVENENIFFGDMINFPDFEADILSSRNDKCSFSMQKKFKGESQYTWINYSGFSELDAENLQMGKKEFTSPFLKRDLMVYFSDVQNAYLKRKNSLILESEKHLKDYYKVDYKFDSNKSLTKK